MTGGSLGGTGDLLGTVNIADGGTYAPGNSIGIQSLSNISFASGSTFEVEVDAAGQSDKLLVTGAATIANGATMAVKAASGTYAAETSYTVMSAGSISGMFGVTSDLYFLTPRLTLSGNDLVLTMVNTPSRTVASLAGTTSQKSSGTAIDGLGAGNGVFDAFQGLDEAGASQLLGAATGDAYAAPQQMIDQTFGQFTSAMANRQQSAGVGTIETAPLGYVATQPASAANSAIIDATASTTPASGYWIAPVAGMGWTLDGLGGEARWTTGGLTLGADRGFAVEEGSVYAGVALGYLHSQSDAASTDVTGNSGQVGIYGGMTTGPVHLTGSLAYGLGHAETQRRITGGGLDLTATSSAYTNTIGATFEAAYAFALTDTLTLAPMIGLDASIGHRGGSQESGAGAFDLVIDATTVSQLNPSLGIGLEQQLDTAAGQVTARAGLAWQLVALDAPDQTLRFAGTNASYTIEGRSGDRDRLQVDLGIALDMGQGKRAYTDYAGTISANSQKHGIRLGLAGGF